MSSRGYPVTKEMRAERRAAAELRQLGELAMSGPERRRRSTRKRPGAGAQEGGRR